MTNGRVGRLATPSHAAMRSVVPMDADQGASRTHMFPHFGDADAPPSRPFRRRSSRPRTYTLGQVHPRAQIWSPARRGAPACRTPGSSRSSTMVSRPRPPRPSRRSSMSSVSLSTGRVRTGLLATMASSSMPNDGRWTSSLEAFNADQRRSATSTRPLHRGPMSRSVQLLKVTKRHADRLVDSHPLRCPCSWPKQLVSSWTCRSSAHADGATTGGRAALDRRRPAFRHRHCRGRRTSPLCCARRTP